MFDFKGKNVLITGGSRGIGLATCLAFAKAGANVAFTYHENDDAAQAATRLIEANHVQSMAARSDLSGTEDLASFIQLIVNKWGSLDVGVANAGIWKGAAVDEMTMEEYREMMDVNMTGTFVLAKFAAARMIEQRSGALVFVSSTAGQRGEPGHSHYAASKGAQISFTKSLAVELAPHGIRVNAVAPGWVETDMTRATLEDPAELRRIREVVPLGRVGRPEEVADAILFLSGPSASYITGEIFNVNGGMVLCG